jgi:serine/threonine-protein kinase
MGTPAFCAPEQARGRWNDVDARTDLFSVGATLFTMLTGRHVHEAETSSEQLALAISSTPRSLRDVFPEATAELVDLVDLSLSYDKEDRFQTARAFRAAVQRTIAGLPNQKILSAPPAESLPAGESLRLPSTTLSLGTKRLLFATVAVAILGFILITTSWFDEKKEKAVAQEPTARAAVTASPSAVTPALPSGVEQPREAASAASAIVQAVPSAADPKAARPTPKASNAPSRAATGSVPAVAPKSSSATPPSGEEELFGKRY